MPGPEQPIIQEVPGASMERPNLQVAPDLITSSDVPTVEAAPTVEPLQLL